MNEILITVSRWIYIISIFASLFFLLSITKRKCIPLNLKYLFLYPLGAVLVFGCFLSAWFDLIKLSTYLEINSISLFYHMGFLGTFILMEINNPRLKKLGKYILVVFFVALALGIYYRTDFWNTDVIAAHMGLFIISTLYFIDLFVNVPKLKITLIPAFWVVIGIFICSVVSIPPLTMVPYIKTYYPDSYVFFVVITLAASSFMYLTFIKGVLCLKNHLKS
ncbi:MAG TPA: hypothetical protein PKY29_07290 [Ferruginibacter sp.]|nr:hypothetical protein [Ferruginibacter sp.]HRN79432.1 hypothetical protein [Ferruginibacter sp.]HRO17364.1 hypothetical protein [Ferruginibacter sp.]HRQ21101.1 hypothetical protein [Ferruginibacter sp.]